MTAGILLRRMAAPDATVREAAGVVALVAPPAAAPEPRRVRFVPPPRDAARRGARRVLPAAIETLDVEGELGAILRRRSAALAGTEMVIDVDPPRLQVRTGSAAGVRRALSLLLSALAARPALARLEVVVRVDAEAGGPARLRLSARACLGLERAPGAGCFRTVERRLLERAEELVRWLHGLLVTDDHRHGELRASLEIDVLGFAVTTSTEPPPAGRRIALVSADDAVARSWSRALRSAGHQVERFDSLGGLLRRCDPLCPLVRPPEWVVVDDGLTARAAAAGEALRRALEGAGIDRHRIVVAASAATPPAGIAGAVDSGPRLAAPVTAGDLLAAVAERPRPPAARPA